MDKWVMSLQGITYPEWMRLRTGIDRAFAQQKKSRRRISCSLILR